MQRKQRFGLVLAAIAMVAMFGAAASAQYALPASPEVEQRARKILSQMTQDEKLEYIGGYNAFYIRAIPRLGVPELKMSDGPLGVRNDGMTTAYPAGIAMAATWDTALEKQVGVMMGKDSRARGVHFLLAPGMNIYRAPMCGRNFEYFGEDPFLSSRMAVAAIEGIQSQGVIATAKHYMGNNQEWERYKVSSDIDERTMREIYLPAFEASVKEAHVGAVMNSYNLVNGEHATQNYYLNTEILKKQWGFQGILMSDWEAVTDGVAAANSGMDLEMPDAKYMNKKTLASGAVSQATIDDKVLRILRTAIAFGFLDRGQKDASIPLDNPEAKPVVLKAAEEGMVLLKNNGILPLQMDKYKTIAVIGPNATPAVIGAGGSSVVTPFHAVSLLDGMQNLVGDKAKITYTAGVQPVSEILAATQLTADAEGTRPGAQGEYFNNMEMQGIPALTRVDEHVSFDWGEGSYAPGQSVDGFSARWTAYFTPKSAGTYTFYIKGDDGFRLFVDDKALIEQWQYQGEALNSKKMQLEAGRPYKIRIEYFEGTGQASIGFGIGSNAKTPLEKAVAVAKVADLVVLSVGFTKTSEGEGSDRTFELPEAQRELIDAVMAANKNVVVLLNAGGNVDMSPFLEKSAAVLHAWYPGQEGGTAAAEILLGTVNPSGKLPASFEKRWEDNPVHASYYEKNNSRRVSYTEGVFLGYRYYDKATVKPQFPFGFGLSYTTFKYSDLRVKATGKDNVSVSFKVTNTGKRDGAEVAQVYVGDRHAKVVRPVKELKGFARTELKAGQGKTVTVELNRRAFSYYDVEAKAWAVAPGKFDILVGRSSEKIELKGATTFGE
ncbi:MAG TPA: glycoside hydrolase family 3 C-terminal domain-containing protein [Candidatus Saccharimonadales bacterium]|nr:glycoside hydrolase family 3 C-terminal domain-containing protein [Candidatus Saccharimonadales bacterium]